MKRAIPFLAKLRYWDREFHNSRIMKLAIQFTQLAKLAVQLEREEEFEVFASEFFGNVFVAADH